MGERPTYFRAFKRAFDRRAVRDVNKRARLDQVRNLVEARYLESDDSNSGEDYSSSDESRESGGTGSEAEDDGSEDLNNVGVGGQGPDVQAEGRETDEEEVNDREADEEVEDDGGGCDEELSDEENGNAAHYPFVESESEGSVGGNESGDEDLDDREGEGGEVIEFADDNERAEYVATAIREWTLEGGVLSMRKVDKLLTALHPLYPNLPLSYKTLLQTPSNLDFNVVNGAQMWYKGIKSNLNPLQLQEYFTVFNEVKLDINMDGLPLFKKSRLKFWPILGKLVGTKNEQFIIAFFFGSRDPDANELLNDYVAEVVELQEDGFTYDGRVYDFQIRNYICDAPARATVKCVKDHGGYCACEKCEVEGEWIDSRMTYCQLNERLRTDDSFTRREQPDHHHNDSPMEVVMNWGPVSKFRFDGMHLVFLGVYKRLIYLAWRKWNGPWKLRMITVQSISDAMEALTPSCPSDFNRPPKSFSDVSFFKATEFRRSLLYNGLLVFRDNIDINIYINIFYCFIVPYTYCVVLSFT